MGLLSKASGNKNQKPATEKDIPVDVDLVLEELPEEITGTESGIEKTEASLDEMGIALGERIRRLEESGTTPFTALNLLKAYAAFQSGLCLSLKDGVYYAHTSVGMSSENVSIPENEIWTGERAGSNFFRLNSFSYTGTNQENLTYWVFPLDSKKPWNEIIILGADSAFNPGSVSVIISGTAEKFRADNGKDNSESITELYSPDFSPGEISREQDALEKQIADYNLTHSEFHCLMLEIPASANEVEKNDFSGKVSKMLNGTGNVYTMKNGSPLILLPKTTDRDLIAHRLLKCFDARPLASFGANSPGSVLRKIQPLL